MSCTHDTTTEQIISCAESSLCDGADCNKTHIKIVCGDCPHEYGELA